MTRFFTTASALVLGAILTGCATQPNFPIENKAATPGPPPAPASSDYPTPRSMPSQGIDSQTLAAPGAREPAPTATQLAPIPYTTPSMPAYTSPSTPAYTPPASTYTPPPAPVRRQLPQPKPLAQGRVVNDSKPPIETKKGDTLIAISRRTGAPIETLAKLNGLKEPYRLHPGDTIKLPSRRYYVVQSGDTIYAIAKRFSMDAADLAEFNEFVVGAPIHGGDKIYLPADAKDRGPPPAPKPVYVEEPPAPRPIRPTPRPAPQSTYPTPAPTPYQSPYQAPERTAPERTVPTPAAPVPYRPSSPTPTPAPMTPYRPPSAEASPPPTDAQIAAAGRGKFNWPVRGDVVSRFGPTGGGQRNDGVNIAAAANQAVMAAAKGEVVYAGNQVPGFGNLVLVKHDGGWVTAYAHLSNIDVKMRQTVTQGQVIGQVGQTGGVDQPQLHFELRYAPTPADKARPVDPMLVLPR